MEADRIGTFLIAAVAGVNFSAIGLAVSDVVVLTLLDSTSSATERATSAILMVVLLAGYLYYLRHNLRSSYGSAEILGSVAIVWLTANFGPKAAPTVPLFILGLLSGAFLVVQGLESIKAGLSGKDDLLAALMIDFYGKCEDERIDPSTVHDPTAVAMGPSAFTRENGNLPQALPVISDADLAAQKMLLVVADTLVSSYEKFSGWQITGFAAVTALMVANHDQVVNATKAGIPKLIVYLFLWAALLHALQRLINVFVQGATNAAREGEKSASCSRKARTLTCW